MRLPVISEPVLRARSTEYESRYSSIRPSIGCQNMNNGCVSGGCPKGCNLNTASGKMDCK